jgi:hypothetical protein
MDGIMHGWDCSSEKSAKGITFQEGDLVLRKICQGDNFSGG